MFVNIAQLYTKKKMIVNNLHEEKGYLMRLSRDYSQNTWTWMTIKCIHINIGNYVTDWWTRYLYNSIWIPNFINFKTRNVIESIQCELYVNEVCNKHRETSIIQFYICANISEVLNYWFNFHFLLTVNFLRMAPNSSS